METGEISPENIHVPSIYVDRVVLGKNYEKRIEVSFRIWLVDGLIVMLRSCSWSSLHLKYFSEVSRRSPKFCFTSSYFLFHLRRGSL